MNQFFKVYLKNVALAVVLVAMLIGIGAYGISAVSDVELRRSTYTRTEFDFHIAAPDAAQVQAIEKDPAVKAVFPYYAYKKAFSSSNNITLIVSDAIDRLGASVLTEGTLVEGSFDRDGAMIDKTAADTLGVGVGDSITFNLLGKRVTREVVAIYLPSTLAIMEDGVVAVSLSGDLASISTPAAYGGAFIVANDRSAVSSLLSGYVGEGNVALTYEQYVTIHCPNKMPGQSDADYETNCKNQYEAYRKNILASAQKGGGQVVDKLEAYSLVKQQTLTTENSTRSLIILTAIASFAIFAVVGILFIVHNKNVENDRIRRDEGLDASKMLLSYSLSTALTAIAVSAVTALAVFTVASGTYFLPECIFIVLSTALPVLAGIPVVLIAASVYVKNLYRVAAKSASLDAPEESAETDEAEQTAEAVPTEAPAQNAESARKAVRTQAEAPAQNEEPARKAVRTQAKAPAQNEEPARKAVRTQAKAPAQNEEPARKAVRTQAEVPAQNDASDRLVQIDKMDRLVKSGAPEPQRKAEVKTATGNAAESADQTPDVKQKSHAGMDDYFNRATHRDNPTAEKQSDSADSEK